MRLIKKGPNLESAINPIIRVQCETCRSIFEGRKNELKYDGLERIGLEWKSRYWFDCPLCQGSTLIREDDLEVLNRESDVIVDC